MSSILKAITRLQAFYYGLFYKMPLSIFTLIATKRKQSRNLFLKENENLNKTLTFIIEFRYNNNRLFE
ncbi:hypothetical protein [Helicobacter pylori]|uniref:hypothetical protein n=1 Tax=Helicobacter pylori TaxID=210 RepID=UPI0027385A6D|nr:hypothetical protein [Helicobacter pylori]